MTKKMIKNLMLILSMVVLCFAAGMTASAETWDDYEYAILEDGTVEITRYIGSETEVEIPSEIDGKLVTSIGDSAFNSCYEVATIEIPKNIVNIGKECFLYCFSLKRISVSDYNECYSNDEYGALFNKDKTIMYYYPPSAKLEKYIIPNSVQSIQGCTFVGNVALIEVVIPDSVTEIEFYNICTFDLCINLKRITYSSSLENITFMSECSPTLDTVIIPNGVEKINNYLLVRCPLLKDVYIEDMDVIIGEGFMSSDLYVEEEHVEEYSELIYQSVWGENGTTNLMTLLNDEAFANKYESYHIYLDEDIFIGTIHCHSGSTAETYAIENGIDYVLTHFYEDDWTYDYDNFVKYRKCIHCDEIETEMIEFVETEGKSLFDKFFDLLKSFFDLIISWFK